MVFGVFGAAGDWQSKADEMAEHENCKRRTVRECFPRRRHAKLEALLPACVPGCLPAACHCLLLPVCRVSLPACCVPRVGSRLLATVAARHLKRFVSHLLLVSFALLLLAAASSVRTHQANSVEAQYYKCVVHGQPLRKHPNGSNGGGGDRMRYSYELEMMVRN